jgi:hypothetical protein
MIDKKLREYFSVLGQKSAKARKRKISAKRRHEIASNAAKSRWTKRGNRKKARRGGGRKQ